MRGTYNKVSEPSTPDPQKLEIWLIHDIDLWIPYLTPNFAKN